MQNVVKSKSVIAKFIVKFIHLFCYEHIVIVVFICFFQFLTFNVSSLNKQVNCLL